MYIEIDNEQKAKQYVILLNGRALKVCLAANDSEGWVEIPDIGKMAPISSENSPVSASEEVDGPSWYDGYARRIYGEVVIMHKDG